MSSMVDWHEVKREKFSRMSCLSWPVRSLSSRPSALTPLRSDDSLVSCTRAAGGRAGGGGLVATLGDAGGEAGERWRDAAPAAQVMQGCGPGNGRICGPRRLWLQSAGWAPPAPAVARNLFA